MSCERYAAEIVDHALGADLSRDGARHLAECAACRAAFDGQQRAMRAIEQDLAQLGAIEPSGDFAARVRTRIESRERARVPAFWWLTSAAAAAAAILLVAAFVIQRADRGDVPREAPRVAVSSKQPAQVPGVVPDVPAVTAEPPAAASASRRPNPSARDRRAVSAAHVTAPVRPDAEVIVPPDQALAIARLVALVRSGQGPDIPAKPAADPAPPADLVIAPLTIDALVVPDVEIASSAPAGSKSLEKE
jgi:hypothetical protein